MPILYNSETDEITWPIFNKTSLTSVIYNDTEVYSLTSSATCNASILFTGSMGIRRMGKFKIKSGNAFNVNSSGDIICTRDISKISITGNCSFKPGDGNTYYSGTVHVYKNNAKLKDLAYQWWDNANCDTAAEFKTISTSITNLKEGDVLKITGCGGGGGENDRTEVSVGLTFKVS